jgi:hypothetical protein
MMTQAWLNHMMIHDGGQIVQTFEDIVESWANLVNPTAEDCHYIFQVTYGWFYAHDQWEYALGEIFTAEQSLEYFKAGNVVSRNLDGIVNDAYNVAVDNNDNKRVSKGCIARLSVNVKTD